MTAEFTQARHGLPRGSSFVPPMELREFAEHVLFATTLEEKLRCPGQVTDEQPGAAIAAPAIPGRPPELRFKPTGQGRSHEFPGMRRLDRDHERGRLLHFFANHELLAVELMAMVLLRFPKAPRAFRQGVLKTLRDEQEHTRWYLDRMRACGVAFGELPVSGYFWRCIAPMEHPIDYVAGLSLTFEQANLDFARHFSAGFAAAGDNATAALLDRIYRDEIGHVAHGLKWFRRWKNPRHSDWEAFCRQLKFPLSPQRAKGLVFNARGRRDAGLDADFIAELDVYARSRGRTPGVFVFNPFTEAFIAGGRSFTPVKAQRDLQEDLANLPAFLCRQDDIVITSRRPSLAFLRATKRGGFATPEFLSRHDFVEKLATRKVGRLRPWAWGPDSVELLSPLFSRVRRGSRRADACFNPAISRLYAKSWSAEFLRELLDNHRAEPWLCSPGVVGVEVRELDDTMRAIRRLRDRGHHRVVAKADIGLAGRNAIRLWEPEVSDAQLAWLRRTFSSGLGVVIEPWLDRVLDFSAHYEMTARGLKLRGFTGLINDHRGQYVANWAAPNCRTRVPTAAANLLRPPADVARRVHCLFEDMRSKLETRLAAAGFLGPLGIDAFVFRCADGAARLKPVVEINPRYTMGRVTLELMQRTASGRFGVFRLVNRRALATAGYGDFAAYAHRLTQRLPLHLVGEPSPRIDAGALCLNDPAQARVCLATFAAGRSLPSIGVETDGSKVAGPL